MGNVDDWLSLHQERLRCAFHKAGEHTRRRAAERAELHSKKEYVVPIKVGHRVYCRNRPLGRNKIQDSWSPVVYKVVDVTEDEKGYVVEPADCSGPPKKVNRRDIRRCLVLEPEKPQVAEPQELQVPLESESGSSSDESGIAVLERTPLPVPVRQAARRKEPQERPEQRRSARTNKGQNPNPYNQPRSAVVDSIEALELLFCNDWDFVIMASVYSVIIMLCFFFAYI